MRKRYKNNNPVAFFLLGSLYPLVTGGMEIFNYYFLKHQLSVLNKKNYYWSRNSLQGFETLHVKMHEWRPTRLFKPLQLLIGLMVYRSRISYIYTGYARQGWMIPYCSALLLRLFRLPYIVTIHSGGKPNWGISYPYKYFFNNAHILIGVSEAICADYSKLLDGKEIQYIPPLIPFSRSTKSKEENRKLLHIPANAKVLLFAGSIKKMKNPDKILNAFVLLGDSFLREHQLMLVMAGGGEMLEDLKNDVRKNGLEPYVVFPGWVSRELMPDYFSVADYYVISSDYEGTSVSLLEAMFNTLPVIAADSPGLNSMVRNGVTALMYPAQDVELLANSIRILVSNPALGAQLASQAGLEFEKKYSYELMIKKYEKLFNSIIL